VKLEDTFEWVEEKALGAASLAQVHKAKLRSNGHIVALKLQYPNLRFQTKLDLWVIRQLTKAANKLAAYYEYTGLDFTKFLQHFEKSLCQELDFKQEVINSERLRDYFKGFKGLYLPKMHVLESSKRAIIMEYVEGDKITDLDTLEAKFGKASRATDLLLDIYARMIFLHGHVHCDAHPGNIIVR
jgi:aarF domain-containing kinase